MKDLSVLVDSMGEWTAEDSAVVHFDLAALGDSGLARWLSTATPLANKVKGISASHTKLTQANLMKLLSIALQDRVFLNLAYLDVSYCEIPEMAVNMLGEYLNPFSGGYNISILNLTRCKLGYYGSAKILESLYANSTLKELVLTGNLCTDKALPILHTGLTKYMNQIETIGLGSNSLTSAGIRQLCSVLELPGRPLKCLLLENNPDIGDSCLDELFVSLNKGSVLETLSLSGCCIGTCQWARYLPFIGSLRTLDLSYNQIGDSEFGVLCKALETCYCLRHLDLAFNRFWGTNCNVIEQMVASNGALQTLSLKGNRCADSVWTALHRGMLLNKTLLNLNLSDCDITMVNAKEICKLFEMNDICSIDFSNNPLPVDFILSPREQTMQNVMSVVSKCQPVDGGGGGGRVAVLPLSPHAHVLSIALSEQWCAARARQVELSLNSLCIVADRQHVIPQKEERSEYFPASSSALITPNSISASQDGSAEQTNTATYSSHRGSSIGDASTNMARGPQALTRPGTIALSELYLSPAALRAHVLESELANTAEPRVMHVAYGRAALLIGHIDITSLTTFAEARLLVHPLVQEYVSTILLLGASPEVHGDLVSKYSLMDPAGLTLTDEDAKLRRVWPEFCMQAEPVLVVRPGNWVCL